jgi:NTE family protein
MPQLELPIVVGVSAGAVNAAHLASDSGPLPDSLDRLASLWTALSPEQVFATDPWGLASGIGHWAMRLLGGGHVREHRTRGLVDTDPLRESLHSALQPDRSGALPGIARNLDRGTLRAIALGTTNYATGQSVVWVEGKSIETWERPKRRSVQTRIGVEHVMASAALPLLFPAVQIGSDWYGDGGLRLTAPLSPALHLGAGKILAISTRYDRSQAEADHPATRGYPPTAQILGVIYNAIFLDLIDQDVVRLERLNRLLRQLPEEQRDGLRVVDIMVVRPSRDLGRLASEYEMRLPAMFRWMTRGLGTRQTSSPDILSLLMFQEEYISRLIALGEEDGEARMEELAAFVNGKHQLAARET